jgi:predicted  nucleic acid-binding Zn-ribbon protein
MSGVKQMMRASSNTSAETDRVKALCQRLLSQQPQSERLLEQLMARAGRPFAPIHDGRCSACNVKIASARIQAAKAGEFINCAHCVVFLYYDSL